MKKIKTPICTIKDKWAPFMFEEKRYFLQTYLI